MDHKERHEGCDEHIESGGQHEDGEAGSKWTQT
jgi:hypothetical protein